MRKKDSWLARIVRGNEKRRIARKGQELILMRQEGEGKEEKSNGGDGKGSDGEDGEGSDGEDGERGIEVATPTTISIQIHLNR